MEIDKIQPQMEMEKIETRLGVRLKPWVRPVVIVSQVQQSRAHVTQFTYGTDTGGAHSQYGS